MKKLDFKTIIAISAIAWIVLIISHEVIGHGGAAYMNGGKLAYFDSMFARYISPDGGFTFWQSKFNTAAGSLLNVLMMIVATVWFFKMKNKQNWIGFGLWVFVLFAAFQSGCYIAFSQFLHTSMDWQTILIDIEPQWPWKIAELFVGLGLIIFGLWFGRKYHFEFMTSAQSIKVQKAKIIITPWLVASIISTAAAFVVPIQANTPRWLMVLGGFGNSFNFLIFMLFLFLIKSKKEKARLTESFDMNVPTIIIGAVMVILYVFVFGRGVHLV